MYQRELALSAKYEEFRAPKFGIVNTQICANSTTNDTNMIYDKVS